MLECSSSGINRRELSCQSLRSLMVPGVRPAGGESAPNGGGTPRDGFGTGR